MTAADPAGCPHCGCLSSVNVSAPGDLTTRRGPQVGDVAVCGQCCVLTIHTAGDRRAPTVAELAALVRDDRIVRHLIAVAAGWR